MIERKHRVRLATTEVGLELHDRVPAESRNALHGTYQKPLQALGEERAPKELLWVAVLGSALPLVNLPKVGRELRLLVLTARHVCVGRRNLSPRLCAGDATARLNRRARQPPLLRARLLLEH